MGKTVGIRREDKNEWERRVPMIPSDLAELKRHHDLSFLIQPSPIRVFTDADYSGAGLTVQEDLGAVDLLVAVKEIPSELLLPGKPHLFFSHVIKGQPYNMPLLRRLMELDCSLVDYERIADDKGRRLIFFSHHAGYAGMIETLWGLGRRLAWLGISTPFARVRHAYEYASLEEAKEHLREIGEEIWKKELPAAISPLMFGLAGYGNVSQGCQAILDCLQVPEIPVAELAARAARDQEGGPPLLRVVFKEEDMVRPVQSGDTFELQDYYRNPRKYAGCFDEHLPHLDVLVNTIYWEEKYPRLVTNRWARQNYGPGTAARLQVIGDISCDIEGSIELTRKVTAPDVPCFVYDPASDSIRDGVEGDGPVVMAVDNLPCELPRESSEHFSTSLREMVPVLAAADWEADFSDLALPAHLKRAVIVHRGRLTPDFEYLKGYLEA